MSDTKWWESPEVLLVIIVVAIVAGITTCSVVDTVVTHKSLQERVGGR